MQDARKTKVQLIHELAGLRQQLAAVQASEARREQTGAEQALAERIKQVEAVRAVTVEITRELDLTTLLSLITQRAVELVEAATSGVVYLWDEATTVPIPQAWHSREEWTWEVHRGLGAGMTGTVAQRRATLVEALQAFISGVTRTVAQRREGLLVNDYQTSPYAAAMFVEHLGPTAVVAEPLLYRERLVGVIALSNEGTGRPFTTQNRELLALFAAQAAVAIENARLYEEVRSGRDFLQSIAENSANAIVTTDVHGRVTYWSPGAEELAGYRA